MKTHNAQYKTNHASRRGLLAKVRAMFANVAQEKSPAMDHLQHELEFWTSAAQMVQAHGDSYRQGGAR